MIKAILMAIFCGFFVSAALATSGRTDSKGCHNSKKAGYHCHSAPVKAETPKGKPDAIPKVNKTPARGKNKHK